ncbi:DUF2513 domain-containing protein [Anaerotignum sp. MB30-C6]|uniref:DUF2513 domain-containing protein n=1 Tax=Anaerotignum sp. MB30-C6 TaxID=3070814 RepID=UPI0027DE8392|nr:DUF2513 domain-containing protein [Anaerotignum sp. MB30-C6]WMI81569.1 DUF2513 domain-containing protein [Anaerotignum sp. MB30-C6]
MKLNPDCTRALLIAVEKICDINNYFSAPEDLHEVEGDFTHEEIAYHARQCYLAGLFYEYKHPATLYFDVTDLSPKGHEFLANIRSEDIWNSVKTVSTKIGASSLSAITTIASNVVSELIKSYFGIGSSHNI